MPYSILVVDDEPKVLRFITKALIEAGMHVESLSDLTDLEAYLKRTPFDLIVLDRLVGKADSVAHLHRLKSNFPTVKVLVLSALGEVDDRVTGLEHGADDYLAKPFHVRELLARVNALLRRNDAAGADGNSLHFVDLEISLEKQEVKRGGRVIALTAKEFKLLTTLARKAGKVFSRAELLDRVWGVNADPGSNVIEVTMRRLREKIDAAAQEPLIHTKRGAGYWFGEGQDEE